MRNHFTHASDKYAFKKKTSLIRQCVVSENVLAVTLYVSRHYLFRLYRMNDDVYVSPNVLKVYTVSYLHYTTIGTVVGIIIGLVVSFLFPTTKCVDRKLSSPSTWKFMYPDHIESKGTMWPEEYRPVIEDTNL